MTEAAHLRAAQTAPPWLMELWALLRVGGPLIAAQLATIALTATDVVMLGWLGPEPLAASALAGAVLHPLLFFGTGVSLASAPLIAQALGARRRRDVRRSLRQGLWAAIALAAVMIPLLMFTGAALRLSGQGHALAAMADRYVSFAAWHLAPFMGFVVLRGFIAAHGQTRIVLLVTLAGVGLNVLGNYGLIFGNFGLPRMELAGAGLSTVLCHSAMFALLALHVARTAPYRRYAPFARFWRADWARFRAIFAMGLPIGLMLAAETGLFSGVALLMGLIGPDALAAHAIALQLAAIAFMTPLGLGQATTARVGLAAGRRDGDGVRRAAWVAMGATLGFMALMAAVFVAAPRLLVGVFLDDTAATSAFGLAVSYLGIAALFQLADGAQVSAASALRGLGDTRAPMLAAVTGYWAIGLPAAWTLGFPLGLEGVGVWLGIAVGLAAAAAMLIWRLAVLTAPTRLP